MQGGGALESGRVSQALAAIAAGWVGWVRQPRSSQRWACEFPRPVGGTQSLLTPVRDGAWGVTQPTYLQWSLRKNGLAGKVVGLGKMKLEFGLLGGKPIFLGKY